MSDKVVIFDSNGENIKVSSDLILDSVTIDSIPVNKSSTRLNVDPTSNVGPGNGLLVPSPAPLPQLWMPIRLTQVPSLQFANPYLYDPNNDFTVGTDYLQFNNVGLFQLSFDCIILANNANFRMSFWIIPRDGQIFINAPLCANAIRVANPINAFGYSWGYVSSGSSCINVTSVPSQIGFAIYLDNTSSVEIIRSSCFTVTRI